MNGYSEVQDLDSDDIWSEKVRCSSKIMPRLRAEWVVSIRQLSNWASCRLYLMRKNSFWGCLKLVRLQLSKMKYAVERYGGEYVSIKVKSIEKKLSVICIEVLIQRQ